jgi:NAD(P)-dependent dehydrogenase (short-subunit alcohol dehydrogenase family)
LNGIAVISGTTHGIGRVTSRELAKAGYTVVMLCRDLTAARNVRDEILAQVPGAAIHVIRCDLASFSSVRECAHALRGAIDQITLLINNASAAYSQSKLVNVMYTFALARRLAATQGTANCLHPGVVATNLLPGWLRILNPLLGHVIDPEAGARSSVYLALSSEAARTNGCYFDEYHAERRASQSACDVELQEALWNMSERWTGT